MANRLDASQWLAIAEHEESIQRAVSRFIARRPQVLARHTRDDLVQESRAAACAALATYLPEGGVELPRYVFGCVKFALMRYASQAQREFSTPEDVVDHQDDVETDSGVLNRLLRRLTGEERQFIVLRYGLRGHKPHSERELSAKLCVSQPTVNERQKRIEAKMFNLAQGLRQAP